MKRRRILIAISACIGAVLLAIVLWPRDHEPLYNSIPLSTWLERAGSGLPDVEFEKAIQHMGTNALPMLVRSVDYRMTRWRVWLRFRAAPKLPKKIADSRLVHWLTGDLAQRRAYGALDAFGILGRRAVPALNELRRIASKQTTTSFTGEAILRIIADIPADYNEPPPNQPTHAAATMHIVGDDVRRTQTPTRSSIRPLNSRRLTLSPSDGERDQG